MIATGSEWPIPVHGIVRNKDKEEDYSRVDDVTRDIHVLTSAGDEELDYTETVRVEAELLREELKRINSNSNSKQFC